MSIILVGNRVKFAALAEVFTKNGGTTEVWAPSGVRVLHGKVQVILVPEDLSNLEEMLGLINAPVFREDHGGGR